MDRAFWADRPPARARTAAGLAAAAVLVLAVAGGADGPAGAGPDSGDLADRGRQLARSASAWYAATPPADRVTWGGLAASAGLALGVLLERAARLRTRKTLPPEFAARFQARLEAGKLDRGKALDFCELNPSPASRVALAAVRRWGRPAADLERAVALALRAEAGRLRRNAGTLRRVAALAPLLGLLGTLSAVGRVLAGMGPAATAAAAGPALAQALGPLTAGVALATLALVAYDAVSGRVEALVSALEAVGAATVDAVALATPPEPPARTPGPHAPASGPARTPHQVRLEVPKPPPPRPPVDDDDDFD